MTVTDAIGRIAQIQATLVQLETGTRATSATSASSGSSAATSTSAADFASALSGALGATDGTSTGAVTGSDVVADAKKYLGVPYVFGGTSASGLDCSGLVQRVFKDLGIDVPRLVSGQSTVGTEVPSLAQAQPGDLIVTNGGEHIVIYAGDGKVIHAPSEGRTVSLVDNWMKDSDIVTIRRVVPQAAPAVASPAASAGLGSLASLLSGAGSAGSAGSSAQADMLRSLFASLSQGGSL
ncbi:C40 family peptidase [Leifsonia shinshuensis]|uniref:C40 family peptidase n=1 Tax=Leifsonia shinshuensis TaxID=150026 RepID=UPI002858A979|nr:C40 family peptidase [Leifsonia shinshuensis]MDR6972264.1 cell wall-associated NlpC family hydrolase [Leifsonia shinshuensis]